jgi:seryl-tRNA synthetase
MGYQEHKYDIEVSTPDEGQFPNVSNRSIVRFVQATESNF